MKPVSFYVAFSTLLFVGCTGSKEGSKTKDATTFETLTPEAQQLLTFSEPIRCHDNELPMYLSLKEPLKCFSPVGNGGMEFFSAS